MNEEARNLWEPVITTEVETDAGQLSVLREDADGEVSLVVDPRPRSP